MSRRIRNYSAMRAEKLTRCYKQLKKGYGEAYTKCLYQGSGDPYRDIKVVEQLLREAGVNPHDLT